MLDNVTSLPTPPVESKTRTITLTNRAPIMIKEDEWPVIAQGMNSYDHDSGTGWSIEIRVRKGKWDYLIHANYYLDNGREEDWARARVGRLISHHEAAAHLWKHMAEVGDELRERIEIDRMKKQVVYAMDNCFADLKPQTY